MDNNIYLISYLGGMHGEFLANLISQDQNYYTIESKSLENNKHQYIDPLHANNMFIKLSLNHFNYPNRYRQDYKLITDRQREFINSNYSEKNLCVLTHIWNDSIYNFNLPRLKPIRLYCDDDYLLLTYAMAVIKAWILPFEIKNVDAEFFINNVDSKTKLHIQKILERKSYYWIERLAISKKQFNLDYLITFYFDNIYTRFNHDAKNRKYKMWNYLNIGDLMLNSRSNLSVFRDSLALHDNLSLDKISEYHQANLRLIDNKFNITYENLSMRPDKFLIIKDYILKNTDRDFWLN